MSDSDLQRYLLQSDLERARMELAAQRVVELLTPHLRREEAIDLLRSYTLEEAAERMKISLYDLKKLRDRRVIRWRVKGQKIRILEGDIRTHYAWEAQFPPGETVLPMPETFDPFHLHRLGNALGSVAKPATTTARERAPRP